MRIDDHTQIVMSISAAVILMTDAGVWIAWLVTSVMQLPALLGAYAYATAATYWWYTQPERVQRSREYEKAPPLPLAEDMGLWLAAAGLGTAFGNGEIRIPLFRTRHELRDFVNLATDNPVRFQLHMYCALHFGQ